MHMAKLLILKCEWITEKIPLRPRVSELVDVKSLYKVMSHKPTENRTREPKGDV